MMAWRERKLTENTLMPGLKLDEVYSGEQTSRGLQRERTLCCKPQPTMPRTIS
jgi:hypothetical protein